VAYWKARVELFGAHRAFLPLSLVLEDAAGHRASALSQVEVDMIRQGYVSLCPPDPQGCMVIVCRDLSREPNVHMGSSMMLSLQRCGFHWLQVVSEYSVSQTNGMMVILPLAQPTRQQDELYASIVSVLKQIGLFPIHEVQVHFLECNLGPSLRNWLTFDAPCVDLMRFTLEQVPRLKSRLHLQQRRSLNEAEDLMRWARELTQIGGLHPRSLPKYLGGYWDLEKGFEVWFSSRIKLDTERVKFLLSSVGTDKANVSKCPPRAMTRTDPRVPHTNAPNLLTPYKRQPYPIDRSLMANKRLCLEDERTMRQRPRPCRPRPPDITVVINGPDATLPPTVPHPRPRHPPLQVAAHHHDSLHQAMLVYLNTNHGSVDTHCQSAFKEPQEVRSRTVISDSGPLFVSGQSRFRRDY